VKPAREQAKGHRPEQVSANQAEQDGNHAAEGKRR
jgi:hypothetical protein